MDIVGEVLAGIRQDIVLFRQECAQLAYLQAEADAHDLHCSLHEREEDLRAKYNLLRLIVSQNRPMTFMQPYVLKVKLLRTMYEKLRITAEAAERRRTRLYGGDGWTITRCCNIYASRQFSPLRDDNCDFDQYLNVCDELASKPSGARADYLYMRLQQYGDLERLTRKLDQTRALVSQKTTADSDRERWKSRYNDLNRVCGILQREWERAEERRKAPFHDLSQEIDARIKEIEACRPSLQLVKSEPMPVAAEDRQIDPLPFSDINSATTNLPQRWYGRKGPDKGLTGRDRHWPRTAKRSPLFKVEVI